jgi:hypothetical protein
MHAARALQVTAYPRYPFALLWLQVVWRSYRFGHISRTLRALQSSTKTSLRIDDEGLLSLQFLMPSPKVKAEASSDAFIEFRVRFTFPSSLLQISTTVTLTWDC